MKKFLLLTFIIFTIPFMSNAQKISQQPLLRHVVMFGWKDGTDANQINKIVAAFKTLPAKISWIKSFEWGINNRPE